MTAWRIELPIAPMGKGRGRASKTAAGIRVYTPKKTRDWEATFAELAAEHLPAEPIEGPLRIDLLAVLPRPQRLMRRRDPPGLVWAPCKPDLDNLTKSTFDALKRHFRDDAQVVFGATLKVYAEKDGLPRTIICIATLGDDAGPTWWASALGLIVPCQKKENR